MFKTLWVIFCEPEIKIQWEKKVKKIADQWYQHFRESGDRKHWSKDACALEWLRLLQWSHKLKSMAASQGERWIMPSLKGQAQ